MKPDIEAIEVEADKGAVCRAVLDALPDWFGIEEARAWYAAGADALPMFALKAEGEVVGFISLKDQTAQATEIFVMGVLKAWHRRGLGARLVALAEDYARGRGARFLSVKTVGPSHPDRFYPATRAFYQKAGFAPIEELKDFWGKGMPCLVLVKALG